MEPQPQVRRPRSAMSIGFPRARGSGHPGQAHRCRTNAARLAAATAARPFRQDHRATTAEWVAFAPPDFVLVKPFIGKLPEQWRCSNFGIGVGLRHGNTRRRSLGAETIHFLKARCKFAIGKILSIRKRARLDFAFDGVEKLLEALAVGWRIRKSRLLTTAFPLERKID